MIIPSWVPSCAPFLFFPFSFLYSLPLFIFIVNFSVSSTLGIFLNLSCLFHLAFKTSLGFSCPEPAFAFSMISSCILVSSLDHLIENLVPILCWPSTLTRRKMDKIVSQLPVSTAPPTASTITFLSPQPLPPHCLSNHLPVSTALPLPFNVFS